MRVYTEVDERGQARTLKWLAAAMAGAPKFTNAPTVVVVLDDLGQEVMRSTFGEISDEFKSYVEEQLLKNKTP